MGGTLIHVKTQIVCYIVLGPTIGLKVFLNCFIEDTFFAAQRSFMAPEEEGCGGQGRAGP